MFDIFEDYDPAYEVYFVGGLDDYEEFYTVYIFLKNGQYYMYEDGHILGEPYSVSVSLLSFIEAICPISSSDVDEILEEWIDDDMTEDFQ